MTKILVGIVGLMLAGAAYEAVAEDVATRAFPAPGQMVDVGGHRLHLYCAGMGSPVVVIDAGWGDSSAVWRSWVQPGVAETTQVCTYDRAGMGHSEPGPAPRTAEQFAGELRALLREGGVAAPYVIVGHSLGGAQARVFAHRYREEVVGVVLIDSMSPGEASASPQISAGALERAIGSGVRWLLTLPARLGILRLLAGPLGLQPTLAPEVTDANAAFSVAPRFVQAWIDEGDGIPASLAQAGAVQSLGAVPLLVLSRGQVEGQDQEWQQAQSELLRLSTNSQQRFAAQSGHNIAFDQPQAATDAIVHLVQQVRTQRYPEDSAAP